MTSILFDDEVADKPDPVRALQAWLEEARETEINDPNAMSLATVDSGGLPDCRTVLLNGLDARGFVFFTNTESAKGAELAANPAAALLFHWKSLRRQVRVRGPVEPVTDEEADAYFAARPRGSQIGAHASQQSHQVKSRNALVEAVEVLSRKFDGADVPRPAHWSGYRVRPVQIEFWLNGEYRLHDRLVYRRDDPDDQWTTKRLYP